ncbi:CotH kinase family protein [Klebsiella pneumoniae]
MTQYNTGNPVPSSAMPDVWDNNATIDEFVNSPELTLTTRTGTERDTLAGIQKKSDDQRVQMAEDGAAVVEETRQNLIPLSRQYMTLDAAQADIANIPVNSTTYVRSQDGSALADEYINNAGTLTATGRKMPSQQAVDNFEKKLSPLGITIQNLTTALQELVLANADLSAQVGQPEDERLNNLRGLQYITASLAQLDGFDPDRLDPTIQNLMTALQNLTLANADLSAQVGSPADERLNYLRELQYITSGLAQLDGFDPENLKGSSDLQNVMTALQNLILANVDLSNQVGNGDLPIQVGNPVRGDGNYVIPRPQSLMRIDLNVASVPVTKDDAPVQGTVVISVDGAITSVNCEISVQGNTSAQYGKKNLNIEFFNLDRSNNVKVKLGDVMPLDTLTFKANWTDASHCRNTMNYRLWEQIVRSRTSFPQYETDNKFYGLYGTKGVLDGSKGFPMGYECVLYVNGDFYGIGHLLSGKKRDSYAIAKNTPTQILLDNSQWHDISKSVAAVASGDIEVKAPKTVTSVTTEKLANFDSFCTAMIGGSTTNLAAMTDKQNIIDFMLMVQFISATDLISGNSIKNAQVFSYTGDKWYFMPYDLDTCYGMKWDGTAIVNPANSDDRLTGTFWKAVISGYGQDAVNSRYAELRNNNIFTVQNIARLIREIQTMFPYDLFAMEWNKWPSIPSMGVTSASQIIEWVADRLDFLDSKYNYTA